MQHGCSRRDYLLSVIAACPIVGTTSWAIAATDRAPSLPRIRGMLLGSLIGDAAGGPIEFQPPEQVSDWMPAMRQWPDDRRLTNKDIAGLAAQFRLLPYTDLRPEPAPYAHWTQAAPAGTVTDDSRHKFMLMAALRTAQRQSAFPINQRQLAQQYLDYCQSTSVRAHTAYGPLCEEWLREYSQAARWVLGIRDRAAAAPVERLWGGVATNAGQMALLPLAGAFAGEAEAAYRAAYQLGFMDNGIAKDLNPAIVAGLAAAIGAPSGAPPAATWKQLEAAMRGVDPYRYGQVPWVARPVVRWLDFANAAVRRSEQSPKRLFEILEQEGQPHYHWDAHFVLASGWALLGLTNFDPLASLHLSLDFGHDTDSTAQLVGAMAGAVHGEEVFPRQVRVQVADRLQADYGESVDEWAELLLDLQDRRRFPALVCDSPSG